jgi:hypothetical protein
VRAFLSLAPLTPCMALRRDRVPLGRYITLCWG